MSKIKDLTNQRFGKLVALYCVGKKNNSKCYYWHCKCDCGNEIDVNGASLRSGNTKSCGCAKVEALQKYNNDQSEINKIPLNTRFGKLVVIEDVGFIPHVEGHRRRGYKCHCDCGNTIIVSGNQLKTGHAISCGQCLMSKGEYYISQLLQQAQIPFKREVLCLIQNRKLRFDFAIFNNDGSLNRYIEFDGRQHYTGPDTDYWSRTIDTLESIQIRDNLKNQYCFEQNIPLVRIPYTNIDKITLNDILGEQYLIRKEGDENE